MSRETSLFTGKAPRCIQLAIAKKFGINAAHLLCQLDYWLKRSKHVHGGRKWCYKTYSEWAEELSWLSKDAIKHVLVKLKKEAPGLVLTADYNKARIDRTRWYSIDYEHPSIQATR